MNIRYELISEYRKLDNEVDAILEYVAPTYDNEELISLMSVVQIAIGNVLAHLHYDVDHVEGNDA